MNYSRQSPSPRYQELLGMYMTMHVEGESSVKPAAATFPGHSLPAHAGRIKALLNHCGSRTLLDYGSGKGNQYRPTHVTTTDGLVFNSIPEFWGVTVRCYDPAYQPFSTYPAEQFDAVISTDVLEHCPEDDVAWIIDEMFSLARHFVYANIACYPAKKHLPNGENAHSTIKPPEWWESFFIAASRNHGNVPYLVLVEQKTDGVKRASAFASPVLEAAGSQHQAA
jgi:hypothetical protein